MLESKNNSSWYFSKKALPYWCIIAVDSMILVMAGLVAEYAVIEKGGLNLANHFWEHVGTWCCMLPLFWIGMRLFHTYSGILRYTTAFDFIRILASETVGFALVVMACYAIPEDNFAGIVLNGFSWTALVVMFILALVGHWAVRILMKFLYEVTYLSKKTSRAFVFGTHEGGLAIARSLRGDNSQYKLAGFVSTDDQMVSRFLMGVRVRKPGPQLIDYMLEEHADAILISPMQQSAFRDNEELQNMLINAGIKIMVVPNAEQWDATQDIKQQQLREVEIEDLLPRDKILVDMNAIGRMLEGKRILITGAAGSIGSEMVRQVARFAPSQLVLVDQAETPMHDIRLYMAREHSDISCETVVGNISNVSQMEMLFQKYRPEYVFHAAAYKHVPMMENNPAMAIQNNTYGTRVIADLAVKYGTKKFVMISTDKAVNPTNVMGCSKRICEIYCQSLNSEIQKIQSGDSSAATSIRQYNGEAPVTQFITTRFGNVLGSNGSVIPLFREQIKKGGPVTVTHPDIIRFFMLIPEACQLVLEAGTMGHGGEIFVFDMGKPVRIADLAKRMIHLSGAKDVEIKFTGLRDGEKLFEEVLNDAEQTKPTIHPKIKVASVREYEYSNALANEKELYDLSLKYDDMAIVKKMKEVVPEYRSQHSKYEVLDR